MANRQPPARIDQFKVIEYGFFDQPCLPLGYVPPVGQPPLEHVQNLAVCTADGVDGFYLMFCTPDWRYVTYCFEETVEHVKTQPLVEFGKEVATWNRR